jgi:uncharacterized damage-inducible protein DinB
MNGQSGPIEALVHASDRVAVAGNWITSVQEALKEVGAEEAAWQPGPAECSIFEIVLHMTVWTDWAANFLRGRDSETVEWPPVTRTDDAAWKEACNDLNHALTAFRVSIAALSSDDLNHAPVPEVTKTTNLSALLSILLHNAYHAGQITKLHERWLAK